MKYKIGYIDEDPQQVIRYERKLRDNFDVVTYDIQKGMPLEELIQRVYNTDIDLLLVDYLMRDKGVLTYNGDQVVRAFEDIKPRFPMLVFTNEGEQAFAQVDNPNIICEKDLVQNDFNKLVSIINKNILVYKKFVERKKQTIIKLIEKGEKGGGLTAEEKHILLDNQLELRGMDKWATEVPLQLLSEEKLQDLSTVRKEAEAYLRLLTDKETK